ncbi:hypothetical protein BayCH28_07520 [Mycolicibacterium sp. CH28]|uniref:hypothetical protein n=1 Tax=Mycolicibacterium sp. CH28 TaxID=2512237 RepID=UPI00108057DB|nr:hypothetical protein [Mycolicibacterium sp. CH28]TGD89200.1 hypothetical protein BayCH28_07520 [Mycolicibacterium sp. CH28]
MATHDPAGATGYTADDAGVVDDAVSAVPFGDPFGPYPHQPYPGSVSSDDLPAPDPSTGSAGSSADDSDPPTDPALPVLTAEEGFDPFAPNAFWFPERPWYRKKEATLAIGAIGAAVVAIVVAAVLLVSLGSDDSEPATPSTTATTTPSTTPLTSSAVSPPPPPPPPETPPSAQTQTWVPQYPQYPRQNGGERPNVTTPQTRPPQISVRPTHRPAFPNQSGGG